MKPTYSIIPRSLHSSLRNLARSAPRPGIAPIALLALAATLVVGCAPGKSVALSELRSPADIRKPIGFFLVHTENQFKTNYQANALLLRTRTDANRKRVSWFMKKPTEVDKDHHADFLCSVQLDPGTHTIDFILGPAGDGFLVNGRFDLEPDLRFELPAQGVTYLGRLNLLSRERKEGERRSGPLLPLIDQSVTGYANSHTDITVEDRADADIPRALELHPVLQGVTISKSLITIPAPKP